MGCGVPPGVSSPFFKGGDEAGVSRRGGLQSTRSMRGQVHEDEGHVLVSDIEGLGIYGGLPMMELILDLLVVQRRNKFLDQVDLTADFSLRVGQMVQHSQASMELLIRQLDHTSELGPH